MVKNEKVTHRPENLEKNLRITKRCKKESLSLKKHVTSSAKRVNFISSLSITKPWILRSCLM